MTPAERMIEVEGRLKRLEDHERKNADMLFDNGGGIKIRLDRLERYRDAEIDSKKVIWPKVFYVIMALIALMSMLINLINK